MLRPNGADYLTKNTVPRELAASRRLRHRPAFRERGKADRGGFRQKASQAFTPPDWNAVMKSHRAAQVTWCVKPGYQAMVTPSARCSSRSRQRPSFPFMKENGPVTAARAALISSTAW